MTKEEIIALIDEKVAGQGNNIDAGSVLPRILKGILDLAVGGGTEVSDITTLTDSQLEALQCGNTVIKNDVTGRHAYFVSYKGAEGLCLTYVDCDNVETVAYNKTLTGWEYDDTTITPISS